MKTFDPTEVCPVQFAAFQRRNRFVTSRLDDHQCCEILAASWSGARMMTWISGY
jgi:hypothetical protein